MYITKSKRGANVSPHTLKENPGLSASFLRCHNLYNTNMYMFTIQICTCMYTCTCTVYIYIYTFPGHQTNVFHIRYIITHCLSNLKYIYTRLHHIHVHCTCTCTITCNVYCSYIFLYDALPHISQHDDCGVFTTTCTVGSQ